MFTHMNRHRKSLLVLLVALGMSLGAATGAIAANCQDFVIKIKNATSDEIKATKFQYKDRSKWRTENMFGVDGHQKIEREKTLKWTRNLQRVGGENTHFKVTYKHRGGGTVWGNAMTESTDTFECNDGDSKLVVIDR